jgi:hypothetical protein
MDTNSVRLVENYSVLPVVPAPNAREQENKQEVEEKAPELIANNEKKLDLYA